MGCGRRVCVGVGSEVEDCEEDETKRKKEQSRQRKLESEKDYDGCRELPLSPLCWTKCCIRRDWQSRHSSYLGISPVGDVALLEDFKQKNDLCNFSFYIDHFSQNVESKFEGYKREKAETS